MMKHLFRHMRTIIKKTKKMVMNTFNKLYYTSYLHLTKHHIVYQFVIFVLTSLLITHSSVVDTMENIPENVEISSVPEVEFYRVPPLNLSPENLAYNRRLHQGPYVLEARQILFDLAATNTKAELIAKIIVRADYDDMVYISKCIENVINNNGSENLLEYNDDTQIEPPTASFKEKLLLFVICSLTCIILWRYLPQIINTMSSTIDIYDYLKEQLITKVYIIEESNPFLLDSILYKINDSYLYEKYNIRELNRE